MQCSSAWGRGKTATSGSEVVDIVDELDRVLGRARLRTALERGLLHRAVAVIVVRTGGDVLLQRRSRNDTWHPGRWTLSCTGHVKSRETYLQAARRELAEELGLNSPLRRLNKLLLPAIRSRRLVEREYVALFASTTDMPPRIDPVELDRVGNFSPGAVRAMFAGRKLTPDAKILLNEYLRLSRNDPGSGLAVKRLERLL